MARLFSPRRLAAAGVILFALVVGLLFVTPASETYIFLPDEAHPVEPILTVQGSKDRPDRGGIYFVDVLVRKATLIERIFPSIRDGATLVPARALNPTGVSEAVRRRGNLRQMSRSQLIAAAVALRELGHRVTVRPTGAFVGAVFPDTPAAGVVEPGDVIVRVDKKPVRTPEDLQQAVRSRPPGSRVMLTVQRESGLKNLTLRTIRDPGGSGRAIVGVRVEPAADIDLPISVRIDAGDVGGPSAGLAFALAVLEKLGRDVDHGLKVAATGELELDGDVVGVGGLEQKTIGARRSDVDVLLVPGENAAEARRYADGLRIIPVRNFQQALRALATLPRPP